MAATCIWHSRPGRRASCSRRNAAGRGTERINNQEVVKVDVTTGRTRRDHRAAARRCRAGMPTATAIVRLGTSYDRNTGRLQALYRVRRATAISDTIISERMERYRDPPLPVVFLPGEKALVVSRHEGFRAVYEMDLQDAWRSAGRCSASTAMTSKPADPPNPERNAARRHRR